MTSGKNLKNDGRVSSPPKTPFTKSVHCDECPTECGHLVVSKQGKIRASNDGNGNVELGAAKAVEILLFILPEPKHPVADQVQKTKSREIKPSRQALTLDVDADGTSSKENDPEALKSVYFNLERSSTTRHKDVMGRQKAETRES